MNTHAILSLNALVSGLRRSLLCLSLPALVLGLLPQAVLAQTFTWSGLGADSNFGTGDNWQGAAAPATGSGVTLDFTGGTQPAPFNNYGAYNDFGSWLLDNSATTSFVITGSSIGLWGKIENDSSNFFGIGISNISARAAIQINPVGGNLTISNSALGGAIYLDNNQSLTVWGDNVNTSRTLTLDTVLSQGNGVGGSGSLTVNQKATVVLLQNNTYGATTLNSGTVQVGNGGTSGSLGSGLVSNNVAGGSSIIFNRSDAITINNQITASSSTNATIYQNGSGSVTLAGPADNISCVPIVNAGTLILGKVSSGSAHAVGGVGTINNGGTVKLGGTGGDQVWSGAGFTVNSGGILDMAGLNEGFDQLSGSGVVTNGGSAASGLTLGENGGSSTFSGSIQDGGIAAAKITLTKAGNGTLALSGANTYSGGSYIKAGTLAVSADNNLGASSGGLTVGAGTLHSTASLATSRSVTFTNAGTFTVDPSTTLTLNSGFNNAAAANAAVMNLNGGGTLSVKGNAIINNDNPFYVNAATLDVDPGAGGTFNATNKTILANAASSTVTMNIRSGTANFGASDFFVMADGSQTASSTVNVLGGTMNLYLGSGQRVLAGLAGSAYLNVSGGTLNVGAPVGNIQIGGDIQYGGNNANGTLTLSGTGAMNVAGSGMFLFGNNSASRSGAVGRLNLFGGTLTTSRNLIGTNGTSYAVFSGGTLKAGAASTSFVTNFTTATISTNGLILDTATFNLTIPQAFSHDATLAGADGGLTKKGTSALTLSANNTYSGGTFITAGTLNVSADNNLGAASGGVTLGGGTLHSTASFGTTRGVTFTNTGTIQIDSSTTLTLSNGFNNAVASGTAGMTVNGGGTLSIKGNVSIANDNAFTLNAATLDVDPGSSGTFNAAGKFTLANASSSTAIMNFRSGTATFSAPDQFFALGDGAATANGVLNILGGTMNINLGNGLRVLFANVGTASINVSGGALVVGPTTGIIELGGDIQWAQNNPSATLTLNGAGSMTVNGVGGIFELGRNSPSKTGAKGTLNLWGGTLTSARSITGADGTSTVNFSGGTLAAGANNSTFLQGLTAANVSTNGAVIDSGSFAVTIAQSLQHDTNVAGLDGGLTKLGAGDLTLAGVNAYNGPTQVRAGRLFVNGSLGTNAVSVTNGATLLGTGAINGPVSILSGATLQPGSTSTSTGTLTLNKPLTLAGNAVLSLNRTNAQTASLVQSTANISYGGTLTITNLGPDLQANDTFALFTGGSYSNSFAAILPPTLAGDLAWDTSRLAMNGTISVVTVASVTISPTATNAECASTITLDAVAGGTPPFTYQWFDNQTNAIAGATYATLTLTNVSSSQAGNYSVLTANSVSSASAIATLTVSDTTAPVIALVGPSPMTVECHGSFTDPGATALDACVGSVTAVASGTVDPNTSGTYTLTYTATDGNGNGATAFRTVNVVDTTAPAISWSFTNHTLSADAGCQALMPDVTGTNYILASDACSDSLTITQTPTNNSILALGTNEVVIVVADSTGNTAYSTNTIVVADTTAPAITLLGANPLTNECHAAFSDPGATAADNCSGIVSVSTNATVDPNTVGVYAIDYVASDAAGNTATNTRLVYVTDTTPPTITLCVPPQSLAVGPDCTATLPDLTGLLVAIDACSATLTVVQLPPPGAVLPLGTTNVVLQVDDGNGNTNTCTALVTVQDQSAPSIATQPQSSTNHVGAGAGFSVSATACTTLSYQWLLNSSPLSAKTDSSLALASAGSCDAGSYQVVVTSGGGAITSAVAVLTVINDPTNISPVGSLALGTQTECASVILNGGSSYTWEINGATGTAGTNWDLLAAAGDIDVQATAANPFTVRVTSLTSAGAAGPMDGLVNTASYAWTLATASGAVSNFDPGAFVVDTAAVSNAFSGTFSVTTNGASLIVKYVGELVPPALTGQGTLGDGRFQLSFSGPSGQTYKVLGSPDPTWPIADWSVLTNGAFGAGPVTFTDPDATSAPVRFYRITSP